MALPELSGDILAGAMQAASIRTGAVVIVLTMLVCVVAVAAREPLRGTTEEPTQTRQRPADVVVTPPPEFPVPGALAPEVFVIEPQDESGVPGWLWWPIAAIGLLGILTAGVLLVREIGRWGRRRRGRRAVRPAAPATTTDQPSAEDDEDDAEVARRAVDAALTPLHEPANARAAVIEAYARLEGVLAERELDRGTAEAPREYLGRVLRRRGMPERSLTILTELFEEARFSLHPISESARSRALSELESTRVALAALGAAPTRGRHVWSSGGSRSQVGPD